MAMRQRVTCVCSTCTMEFIPESVPSRCPACTSEHTCHQCTARGQGHQNWVCAACTFENHHRDILCEVCGNEPDVFPPAGVSDEHEFEVVPLKDDLLTARDSARKEIQLVPEMQMESPKRSLGFCEEDQVGAHAFDSSYDLPPPRDLDEDGSSQPYSDCSEHDEKVKAIIFDEFSTPEWKKQKRSKSISIRQDDLVKIETFAEGNFGFTFKAEYKSQVVIIKAAKHGTTMDDFEELGTYLKLTTCPNVMSMVGVCQEFIHAPVDKRTLALVLPFQSNGDLKKFMIKYGHHLAEREYLSIVLGMARGLGHLHKNNMIPRDVACRNYLVSSGGRIIISDFGLTRTLDDPDAGSIYYQFGAVTIPWRAASPEMLETRKCTKASDVWAFGIVLWELYHPMLRPFTEQQDAMSLVYVFVKPNFSFTLDYGDHKNRGGKGSDVEHKTYPSVLKEAVMKCCDMDPDKRISISGIVEMLTVQM